MNWIKVSDEMPDAEQPVLAVVQVYPTRRIALRVMWCPKFTLEPLENDEDLEYDEETDRYYVPEGWYERNQYDETSWAVCDPVTHWMPLPELPGD